MPQTCAFAALSSSEKSIPVTSSPQLGQMTMLVCSCQPYLALLLGRWHIEHTVEAAACLENAPFQLHGHLKIYSGHSKSEAWPDDHAEVLLSTISGIAAG